MKRFNCALLLLAGSCTLAFAGTAHAQEATPPDAQPGAVAGATPPADEAETAAANDIVVTGSRVITNGNSSPTPVTVVSVDDLLRVRPTTVAEALNDLPVFSGSRGQLSNPSGGTAGNLGGGNSAGNNLNLRNMGAVRTLILFDGHRLPPTNVTGLVDIDMIPQQLLQRVDVVTGGASAVYGSDAVTGVVNFITNRRYNGIKANAQYGITQRGDGAAYNFGIAAGQDIFGGRGHIEGSYEFRDDKGIDARSARDPENKTFTVQGGGTAANPYYLTPFARVSAFTFGGLIVNNAAGAGALTGQTFNTDGVLTRFNAGPSSGATCCQIGGDGIFFDSSLKASLRSHQAFGRLDFDVSDSVHAYGEVAFNSKRNQTFTTWLNLTTVTLSATNPFLAPVYQQQLATARQTTFRLSKQIRDAERNSPIAKERQLFFNGGFEGEFGDGYKWDIGGVYSRARLDLSNTNTNNGRLFAALDAVAGPGGQVVCSVTLTNPTLYPGCVPLNPFGPTSDSPEAIAYVTGRTNLFTRTTLADVSGSISSSPLSTWAGPVAVALSGEYRKISFRSESDARPTDLLNCTGLRFNCAATTLLWNSGIASRSKVSQEVKEGAAEIDIPLLRDSAIAKAFNVNGAVRYTSYDTSGDYTTWKVGIAWELNDALRLRGTRSRDIRAPTLDDLFSPASFTIGNFADTLTGTNPSNVRIVTGGNPNLTAEIGDTKSVGFVLKPGFLPGFSLAVDYFDIRVSNAILNVIAQQPIFQNACRTSGGTSPYCSLYVRPINATDTSPANAVTQVSNTVINIAEQQTNGVDVEMNYATQLFARPASLRLLTTYQPHLKYLQPGIATLDQAGVAFGNNGGQAVPVWRVTGLVRFRPAEDFSLDIQTRWRSALKLSGDPTLIVRGPKVPAATFINLNAAYQIKTRWGVADMFVNVANLADKKAPPAAFYASQNNPGVSQGFVIGDDPLGRAFTFGLRMRM